MKTGFEPGIEASVEVVVSEDLFPRFGERVMPPVLATYELVHQMEWAGRRVLEPYLEEHEEGIGYAVNVTHLGPSPLGSRVVSRARLTAVEGNRVVCAVACHADGRQVIKHLDSVAPSAQHNMVIWLNP